MHRWSRNLIFDVLIPLALLAVGAGVVWFLGTVVPAELPPSDGSRIGRLRALPAVEIAPVHSLDSIDATLQLKAEGSVVPYREAMVASEISGRIISKADNCEAGSYVKAGQVLMEIDATDYEFTVERLRRAKEQEYQALNESDQEITNTQRLIDVLQRDMAIQQRELNRQKSLPKGFASAAELDLAELKLVQSEQQLVTAENQLELTKKRRLRLEAAERLAATQLNAALVDLERTKITAPIDGVVVREDADVNSFVARGTTLVTIEDISKVEVASSLRMDQLYWILDQKQDCEESNSTVRRGYDLPDTPAIIEYEVSGREGVVYRWQGRLLGYDGIGMDPNTRTVPVRVVVDNPQQYIDAKGESRQATGPTALVRGMYVQIKLLIKPQTPLVVVPAEALRPGNRLWQFIRDESVLDPPPEMLSDGEAADNDSVAQAAKDQGSKDQGQPRTQSTVRNQQDDQDQQDDRFDAKLWVAGKVVERRSIIPLESLVIDTGENHPAAEFAKRQESEFANRKARALGDRRSDLWVCEIEGDVITDGSLVVVSPLGSVAAAGLPARAKATELTTPSPTGADPALVDTRAGRVPGQPTSRLTSGQPALVRGEDVR